MPILRLLAGIQAAFADFTGTPGPTVVIFQTGVRFMTTYSSHTNKSDSGLTAVALLLIGAGILLLLDNFGIVWIGRIWDLWPLTLIAMGLAELLHWSRQRET
jgi:Domain of unknown function (DUF5668)